MSLLQDSEKPLRFSVLILENFILENLQINLGRTTTVKGFSHGAIATEIYFTQLMGCVGFSVVVAIAPCEHLHWVSYNPYVVMKKLQSQSYRVNSP